MKKGIIIGIISIIGIIIAISLFIWANNSILPTVATNRIVQSTPTPEVQSDQVLGRLSHSIVLEKALFEKAEKIMVYKTVPVHYTRQNSLSLAQKFNISSMGKIKETEDGSSFASEDGMTYVILSNSGFVEYSNSHRAHNINPIDVPGKLPSDDDAVKIATRFLKDRDLLPDGAEFRTTSHGKIHGTAENGADIVLWEDVQVWYGHKIDGIPVEGTQLMLAIGADGTPIEYFTNWRNYQPYKELSVKTPEQSFEELKIKGVPVGMNNPEKVLIEDSYLAYHTKAGAETEEYLEPVWVFKGNVMVDGKAVDSVESYIPALTDDAVKSLSS
jgi:hypothetical protein